MAKLFVLLIAASLTGVALLGAGPDGSSAAVKRVPRVLTEDHAGRTFTMPRSAHPVLRLDNRWNWSQPRVRGRAVVLLPIDYESDPGFRAWEIHRRTAGTVRITAKGWPNCNRCSRRGRSFAVTLRLTR